MDHRLTILTHKEKWEAYKQKCTDVLKTDPSKDLREHMEKVVEEK